MKESFILKVLGKDFIKDFEKLKEIWVNVHQQTIEDQEKILENQKKMIEKLDLIIENQKNMKNGDIQ